MNEIRLTWNGKQVSEAVSRAGAKGLRDGAEHLLTTANVTIPHETGEMMRSGVADVDEQTLEGTVSYDTPYAVKQHEDTTLQHDEGRRAKWLELALDEERERIQKHIEDTIRQALGG